MALTIYDISKKAGVSIATVSRVLNGSDSVKASTREKVMRVIEKYDYTPNAFARGMGLHSLRTVGILCADSSDLYLAKAVYYLEQELHDNGYESILCCTGYDLADRQSYMHLILSKKVDSLILVGSHYVSNTDEENECIREASKQVPVMLLNASYNHPNVYSTLCNDYASMFEATSSLIRAGIDDILYVYDSNSYSGTKKLSGYKAAMKSYKLQDITPYIHYYDGRTDEIENITSFIQSIADRGTHFHGVIASDDQLAIGAIKYAQRNGLRIPGDLSVIGYNNSMLTKCCNPELTSVDNRLENLTHQLVQTLIGVLSGQEMPTESVFSGKLIKRSTTP
ncbi:MAG: LacI family DNA-binding transcriptional regulator [Lachnospiraceae bacterium]|nr:LacI family DNA-binding transcriptional regulator [Lachnospiraceae bacterium]